MKFQVVTKVPDPLESQGNLAAAFEIYVIDSPYPPGKARLLTMYRGASSLVALRTPVFHVGEVLIVDEDGRELPYPGRKPSKWEVDVEEYDSVEAAVERAQAVLYPTPGAH
jgi:hypothetical protein